MNPLVAFVGGIRAAVSTAGQAARERDWLLRPLGGLPTVAGPTVTADNAQGIGVIYACGRILADTQAQLPLKYFELTARGKVPASAHRTYELLHDLPNPEMSASEFWDTLAYQRAIWGYSFAEIDRDPGTGEPVAFWPLSSACMGRITRDERGRLLYPYTLPNGAKHTFRWDRFARHPIDRLPPLLHLKVNALDGMNGRSPVLMHREALGLTKAAEEHTARFYANSGITAGTFLKVPSALPPQVRTRIEEQLNESRGLSNAWRLKILEAGFDVASVGVPPQVAQLNEMRAFQLEEGARIYRIPLHLLQHMTKTTAWGSGIAELGIGFLTYTMMPWLVSTQQAIYRDVLRPKPEWDDRARYAALYVVNALVRGDFKTRMEGYQLARQNGLMTGNECRELEDLNTVDGADDLWMPANMMPAGLAPVVETRAGVVSVGGVM